MRDNYFFDTYALIELFNGNISYLKYKNSKVVTCILNLFELYYSLIRDGVPKKLALSYFNRLLGFCAEIKPNYLIEASEFRLEIKNDLSYADSLGYTIAMELEIKFLTGDNQFKDLPNVEFIK